MGIPTHRPGVLVALACVALLVLALGACGQKPAKSGSGATGATAPSPAAPADAKAGPANAPSGGEATPENSSPAVSDLEDGDAPVGPDIGSITISAEPGANGGEAIDVDFVAALDAAAAAEIGALSAKDWFAKREAIVGEEKADVMSWRVDPGGSVPETPVELGEATASFVFARYASPGAHRKKVEGEGALAITLGATDFTIDVGQ